MAVKRGIIQSRGLGDIIIALPIAHFYHEQGDEILWPICQEFYEGMKAVAPWVKWHGVETDQQGRFFLQTPLQWLQEEGCDMAELLYLYQYLSSAPEMTDPELYNILKFDQYKYAVAGVPFVRKWQLRECVTRSPEREQELRDRLKIEGAYNVVHLTGSSTRVDAAIASNFLDPAVRVINVDDHKYLSVFDWIPIIEGAQNVVCLDSVFANMIDQWGLEGPTRYWIRRSPWDLTPVMGGHWIVVPTNLPIREPTRIDPQAEAQKKVQQVQAQQRQGAGSIHSHVPFDVNRAGYPTNFMHALKK